MAQQATMSKLRRAKVLAQIAWVAYKPKVIDRLQRAPWSRR
jgi:hypothetical protein